MTNDNASRLPDAFIQSVKPLLGGALDDFLRCYRLPPCRALRFRNARRPLPSDALAGEVPYAQNAYHIPPDSTAGAHPLHEAGAYYLQEPSAMAAAAALRPSACDIVLDLCAAPGGKATQLASCVPEGLLIANEPIPQRALALSRSVERMGVQNAVVTCAYPDALAARWPRFFDKVLADAPCSGEGMFRRHPQTIAEWSADAPVRCARRQLAILRSAALLLREGGRMAYSTCTFNRAENEGVIADFLREHPHFTPVPFALPALPAAQNGMLRLWPHEMRGEGHFIALLEKQGLAKGERPPARPCPPPPIDAAQAALCREALRGLGVPEDVAPNAVFAGKAVRAPRHMPDIAGIRVLRAGLTLGQARGRVFVPDHALALAEQCQNSLPLDAAQAARYLRGEELPCVAAPRGFITLTLCGFALGFGKASQGVIKNHYPKGLRK